MASDYSDDLIESTKELFSDLYRREVLESESVEIIRNTTALIELVASWCNQDSSLLQLLGDWDAEGAVALEPVSTQDCPLVPYYYSQRNSKKLKKGKLR